MLTDFVRDQAFCIAWFALMGSVWFGWGQEDPVRGWRWWLAAGSIFSLILSAPFIYFLIGNWGIGGALDENYLWFGILVGAETGIIALGCFLLWWRRQARWIAWWIALTVGLHFIPMAPLLQDWSLAALGAAQTLILLLLIPRMRGEQWPTSRLVGPAMGATFLLFALVSAGLFLTIHGSPL